MLQTKRAHGNDDYNSDDGDDGDREDDDEGGGMTMTTETRHANQAM